MTRTPIADELRMRLAEDPTNVDAIVDAVVALETKEEDRRKKETRLYTS